MFGTRRLRALFVLMIAVVPLLGAGLASSPAGAIPPVAADHMATGC